MKYLRSLCTLLFGVAVLLFFGLAYPHHLHYQEQYQLFLFDSTYVWEIIKLPGGVADLLGRFCTQFFLFAWVGAAIIAVLLSLIQILMVRLANWGWLYGLSFVPSFLLWLFLLDEHALMGGVWAVLLTLLAIWIMWIMGTVLRDTIAKGNWIIRTVPVITCLAGIAFTWSLMYYDRNYLDEMRMVRNASEDNWKEVLAISESNKTPTSTMVFLKNVALMNDGGLLDRSFKLGNDAADLYNPDTLHITLLDIASPLVYYNYGMMNEAIRLNFENAIQAGFSPFYLKMLTRCAQAVGDQKLVERYTTILHHRPFYGDWQPAPVSAKVKELQKCYSDTLSGVENSESYLVNEISLWYDSKSKVASEQSLLYSMLRCDSRRFWASLKNYVQFHLDEEFPLHAMEAYILFMDKAPEQKRMMLPVEQSVYERYKRFWVTLESKAKPGATLEKVGVEMSKEFGDTYWWYNIFGRKPINVHGNVGHEVAS